MLAISRNGGNITVNLVNVNVLVRNQKGIYGTTSLERNRRHILR